ncbi:hypothetical protein Ancab_028812 [Ancistrocladus abbreviatus]
MMSSRACRRRYLCWALDSGSFPMDTHQAKSFFANLEAERQGKKCGISLEPTNKAPIQRKTRASSSNLRLNRGANRKRKGHE